MSCLGVGSEKMEEIVGFDSKAVHICTFLAWLEEMPSVIFCIYDIRRYLWKASISNYVVFSCVGVE